MTPLLRGETLLPVLSNKVASAGLSFAPSARPGRQPIYYGRVGRWVREFGKRPDAANIDPQRGLNGNFDTGTFGDSPARPESARDSPAYLRRQPDACRGLNRQPDCRSQPDTEGFAKPDTHGRRE